MKTILYILIAVMVGSILLSSIPMSALDGGRNVTLQCTEVNADQSKLNESAEIIKNRLTSFGIADADIQVEENGSTIQVKFQDSTDLQRADDLLTTKGRFEFYETLDRNLVIDQLSADDILFSLMSIPVQDIESISEAVLGYCEATNKSKVEDHIASKLKNLPNLRNVKFAWSKYSNDEDKYTLYMLKNKPSMDAKYISESMVKQNEASNTAEVLMSFDNKGSHKWQELTENNLRKAIAIAMDGEVYIAPTVQMVIKGGNCSITGAFSLGQAKRIAAVIQHGELPLEFKLVK